MAYPNKGYCGPVVALLMLLPATANAEFSLNFQPQLTRLGDPEWLNFNCNRPSAPGGGFEKCDENDEFRNNNGRDTSPFLMERIRDTTTGELYYHTIVGLPNSDFVQESYIKIARYMNNDNGGFNTLPQTEVDDLGPISDSLGNWTPIDKGPDNAYDPLGPAKFSGSGTANPKSTQFRQVINSGGLYQEVTKASFNKKQRITQNINAGALSHQFDLDMSNSTFDQANIAGVMLKNQMSIRDGAFVSDFNINNMPAGSGSSVNITGGKYLYSKRYTSSMTGSSFENEYVSSTGNHFDTWTELWKEWRNPAQNATHLYSGGGKD